MGLKKNNEAAGQDPLAKVKKDALRLLSFRPRSTNELRQRLQRKKHASGDVEKVLEFCVNQGLLDDEKYAKLFALSRMQSRPMGKRLLRMDLAQRGVPEKIVERAIGDLVDYDEKQMALDLVLRRQRRMTGMDDNVSKARLYGYLKRRGFTSEAVYFALSKVYKRVENFD